MMHFAVNERAQMPKLRKSETFLLKSLPVVAIVDQVLEGLAVAPRL